VRPRRQFQISRREYVDAGPNEKAAATRSILKRGGAGGSQFPGRRRKVWDRNPLTTCSATPDAQGIRGVQDRSARQQCPRECAEAQNNGRINTAEVARFPAGKVLSMFFLSWALTPVSIGV
jgi:hypothetical protein